MSEQECYKKIYGDLFYHVDFYNPKRKMSDVEIYQAQMMFNCYPRWIR